MKFFKSVVLTYILISLVFCSHSPFRNIENPNIPFERPDYSVLAPDGGNWQYFADDSNGRFRLNFFKKIPDPKFHSLAVGLIETPSSANFENPQEFENWNRKTLEIAMSANRLNLVDIKIESDNRFGAYSVKYYTKSEDHRAVNRGNEDFLILEDYGYVFIPPKNPKLIVQVSYSERGRTQEIRPNLGKLAESFFDGIKLKDESATQ